MASEQAANFLLFMNGFQASSYPYRKSHLKVKHSESMFRESIIPVLIKAALPEHADNRKRCQAAWSEVEDT